MEKVYQNTSFFFIAILVFVVAGFYRTYFGLFPAFEGITTIQHIHGILFLLWFGLLITQPLLIKYKKFALHRTIGKSSYVIVPLLLLSIFEVSKGQYQRLSAILTKEQNIAGLTLSLPDIVAFAALYIFAMIYKKNIAYHMRYMIGTSILLLGPGLGRALIIYGGMSFPAGVETSIILSELIAGVLLLSDIIKGKTYIPYLVTLLILLSMHFFWHFQMAWWWQAFGAWFARSFF